MLARARSRARSLTPELIRRPPRRLQRPNERARVREMRGFVSPDDRVNGVLATTRCLGDAYMNPFISPCPYIASVELGPEARAANVAARWRLDGTDRCCTLRRTSL